MTRFSSIFAACILVLAIAVDAQQAAPSAEQHSDHEQHARSSGAAASGHGMGTMHEHMQTMREQMARIHAAQDPEERQRLMREHMESMQQHMQMMDSTTPSSSESQRAGMPCAQGDVDEMRALMEQMMEHLRASGEQ